MRSRNDDSSAAAALSPAFRAAHGGSQVVTFVVVQSCSQLLLLQARGGPGQDKSTLEQSVPPGQVFGYQKFKRYWGGWGDMLICLILPLPFLTCLACGCAEVMYLPWAFHLQFIPPQQHSSCPTTGGPSLLL